MSRLVALASAMVMMLILASLVSFLFIGVSDYSFWLRLADAVMVAGASGAWLYWVVLLLRVLTRGADSYVVAAGVVIGTVASVLAALCLYATVAALICGIKS